MLRNFFKIDSDERTFNETKAAEAIGFRIAMFLILLDILFRSLKSGEASWDLFAIIMLSSGIASAYQIKKKIVTKSWLKIVIISFITGISVSVLIAAIMLTK